MKPTVILFSVLALACGTALAAEPGTPEQTTDAATFTYMDVNGDGKISRDEAKTSEDLSASYDAADTNKDGALDESEFSAFEEMHGNVSSGED